MKVVIKRIESINRKGKKDNGKEWKIDVTNIVTDVLFDEEKNEQDDNSVLFGLKDLVYQVGEKPSSKHFYELGLNKLKGHLPLECEIELGQGMNAFGNSVVCVLSIKPLKNSV